jgi:hypothetical protein
MTVVGRFLCMIGVHRWRRKRNSESGKRTYHECERCHRARTTSRSGFSSGGGGSIRIGDGGGFDGGGSNGGGFDGGGWDGGGGDGGNGE